jgi:bifunctional non-homologous end joining protein LigD
MTAAEPARGFVAPMLVKSAPLPEGDDWAAEVKWDGMRGQLRIVDGEVTIHSRTGRRCDEFPELVSGAESLPDRPLILDGEIVCFDTGGRPDFEALRNRLRHRSANEIGRLAATSPVVFVAFDVLHVDAESTLDWPWTNRRSVLESLKLPEPRFRVPEAFVGQAAELLDAVAAEHLEGVVVKRLLSRYMPGARSDDWVKRKVWRTESVSVTGWKANTDGEVERVFVERIDGRRQAIEIGVGRTFAEELRQSSLATAKRGYFDLAQPRPATVRTHGHVDGPLRDAVLIPD